MGDGVQILTFALEEVRGARGVRHAPPRLERLAWMLRQGARAGAFWTP
jgi:hypothetical protein